MESSTKYCKKIPGKCNKIFKKNFTKKNVFIITDIQEGDLVCDNRREEVVTACIQ